MQLHCINQQTNYTHMPKESAVEILVFKPNPDILPEQRGVHENLWLKQRFEQYVSIGVFAEGEALKYYFFEACDNAPKLYDSLVELKADLPTELTLLFEGTPKLFVMGHGHGGYYGLCNRSIPSEEIYGDKFNKIITDFQDALPKPYNEIVVTLEACNTDNQALANLCQQEKTCLARISETHQHVTFCGTGPWNPDDSETGYRASGGFPVLNAPITSTGGGIWKHGNSVIFYHGDYQVTAIKSMFASTKTAKALKINTITYASEVLKDNDRKYEILTNIGARRDILNIEDLEKVGIYQSEVMKPAVIALLENEKQILAEEKNRYIMRVQDILIRAYTNGKFKQRDLLVLALGLKDPSVFEGHAGLFDEIIKNKILLSLLMVSCGKVLIAGPNNDNIIDLLLSHEIDINSVDKHGMTALHYAVQNFYNYREEPLNLIKKLVDSGANLEAKDNQGRTPLSLARLHATKSTVFAGVNLIRLLEESLALIPARINATSSSYSSTIGSSSEAPPKQAHVMLDFMNGAKKSGKEGSSSQPNRIFQPKI